MEAISNPMLEHSSSHIEGATRSEGMGTPPATKKPEEAVRLCKTSGIEYIGNGDRCAFAMGREASETPLACWVMHDHPVDENYLWGGPPRTSRAVFCSTVCRNIYRD